MVFLVVTQAAWQSFARDLLTSDLSAFMARTPWQAGIPELP